IKQVIFIGTLIVGGLFGESPPPCVRTTPAAIMTSMALRRLINSGDSSVVFTLKNVPVVRYIYFVYHQSMNVEHSVDIVVSRIAAAIGEPARACILYCLMDGHARTSTELAVVADVSPSTASAHLNRLKREGLVKALVQGKHRFYSLEGPDVASALEGLSVLAGGSRNKFAPSAPIRLRAARTCYDHMAGALGVSLHDRLMALGWLSPGSTGGDNAYDL